MSEITPQMRLDCTGIPYKVNLAWGRNSLTGGEDDPHYGTEHAGTHAGLEIEVEGLRPYPIKIFLRSSDHQYYEDLQHIIKDIVRRVNESCQAREKE